MTEQQAQVRVRGVDVRGGVLDDDAVAAIELAVRKAVQSRLDRDRGVVTGVSAADIAHAVVTALPRGTTT